MTTKIENIKREIFVTKEHYLAFRQDWKDYINNNIAWISASQFMLFSILTEKDLSKSFKPSPRGKEYKDGFTPARTALGIQCRAATKLVEYDAGDATRPSYMKEDKFKTLFENSRKQVNKFLEPFGKSFTIKMFAKLYSEHLSVSKTQLTNEVDKTLDEAA